MDSSRYDLGQRENQITGLCLETEFMLCMRAIFVRLKIILFTSVFVFIMVTAYASDLPDLNISKPVYEYTEASMGEVLMPGNTLNVIFHAANSGFSTAELVNVSVFLSPDGSIDNHENILLGSKNIPELPVQGMEEMEIKVRIPTPLDRSEWILLAVIDGEQRIKETDEKNNTNFNRIAIGEVLTKERIYRNQPEQLEKMAEIEKEIMRYMESNDISRIPAGKGRARSTACYETQFTYQVPLVVHVVHRTGIPIGQEENLDDQAIINIINGVNDRLRHESGLTFPNPLSGVNAGIELCFAKRDPGGNPTNGIIRYADNDNTYHNKDTKNAQNAYYWPTDQYFNVYIVKVISNDESWPSSVAAGYSTLPSSHGTSTDGAVFTADIFWDGLVAHEAGHYFGLYHNFDITESCENSNCEVNGDRICDTPPKYIAGRGDDGCIDGNTCFTDEDDTDPRNPFRSVALGGYGDQTDGEENYMDYTGGCWKAYTVEQAQKMRIILATVRDSLVNTQNCAPITSNDAGISEVLFPGDVACGTSFNPIVRLKNYGTSTLTSVRVIIEHDGVQEISYDWNGSLAAGAEADLTLPSIQTSVGLHSLYAYTVQPNGQTDGYDSNNDVCIEYETVSRQSVPIVFDMETGQLPEGWVADNPDNQATFDLSAANCSLKNGNNAIRYYSRNVSVGASGTEDSLVSSTIDLSSASTASMYFDLAYKPTYSNRTSILDVSVSTDCGLTWASLYNKTGSALNTETPFTWDPDVDWIPAYCDDWRTETINLDAFCGSSVLVRFKIIIPEYWGQNLYLDNITIEGDATIFQPVLSVTPTSRSVSSGSGATTFSVSNTGTGTMNWTATESSPWVSITGGASGTDSGTITVSYSANSGGARTADIVVTADGATNSPITLTVSQASGLKPALSASPVYKFISSGSGTTTFSVSNTGTGTMNWTATESSPWVSITGGAWGTDSGTITVSYSANSGDARTAEIVVTADGATNSPITITMNQASGLQPVLSASPVYKFISSGSGTTTFSVSNTGTGTMNWTATESSPWVSITGGAWGTDSGTITVSYSANSGDARMAEIVVTADGATNSPITITMNQASGLQPVLSATPTSRSVSSGSGTTTFSVSNTGTGTMNWTASESSSWLSITGGASGTDSGTITVSYSANSGGARTADIVVTAEGATNSPVTLQMNQSAADQGVPGDVNDDGTVDLIDAITALQVVTGMNMMVNPEGDVNGDTKIGIEEALYIMRNMSKISMPIIELDGPTLTGDIAFADDTNWYVFNISSQGPYHILETTADTLTDNYMYLYGPDSRTTLIEEDDDGGELYMAKIYRKLTPGLYYVKIKAYSSTDTGTYHIKLTSADSISELMVTSVNCPTSGVVGASIGMISATVQNMGPEVSASFWLGYLLSTNDYISLYDIPLEYIIIPPLVPGETYACSIDLSIPSSVSPGSYYLGAYADFFEEIVEVDEMNNGLAASNTITITQ